jgi:hypothetical protein
MSPTGTAEWMVKWGAPGVMALVIIAQSFVLWWLWTELKEERKASNALYEARLKDLRDATASQTNLQDRVYDAIEPLEKLATAIEGLRADLQRGPTRR